jgi:hypothetical protein
LRPFVYEKGFMLIEDLVQLDVKVSVLECVVLQKNRCFCIFAEGLFCLVVVVVAGFLGAFVFSGSFFELWMRFGLFFKV